MITYDVKEIACPCCGDTGAPLVNGDVACQNAACDVRTFRVRKISASSDNETTTTAAHDGATKKGKR